MNALRKVMITVQPTSYTAGRTSVNRPCLDGGFGHENKNAIASAMAFPESFDLDADDYIGSDVDLLCPFFLPLPLPLLPGSPPSLRVLAVPVSFPIWIEDEPNSLLKLDMNWSI